jgi:hypothetical protein
MRIMPLVLTGLLLSASACFAETAEQEQRTRLLSLQKLATDARELERCQAVVSVENIAEFQPIVGSYYRKTDELAKSIEDFVSRYAAKRSKQETVPAFRYRIWEASLRSGVEKARPVSALNRESCGALARKAG